MIGSPDRRTGIVRERDQFFRAGEEYEVAVFNDFGDYVNLVFAGGAELYGLKKELFEVVRISPAA